MILFIPGAYPFCYHVRGFLPGVYGNQMVVKDYLKGNIDPQIVLYQAKLASTVVLQRPSSKESIQLIKALKSQNKKVIFDNDDTYKGIPLERLGNEKQIAIAKELECNLDEALRLCDGAVASTEILAQEYRKINPNTIVLKNCIDPLDRFPVKHNDTGKFRIGFIGSVTSNDDYVHIKDQIRRMDEAGMTTVVMGVKFQDGTHLPIMESDYEFWSSLKNVEWHSYVPVNEYMQKLASLALDVAIIPRKDHYFNRCKSNLKFLEMSLLKIPVIAQGFEDGTSPYQGKDEQYMTVIVDNSRWFDTAVEVQSNYTHYKSLAEKAQAYVLRDYNIKNFAAAWIEEINNL